MALYDLVGRMQFTTEHLKRFGAMDISADRYQELLSDALYDDANFFPEGFARPPETDEHQDGGGTTSDVCLQAFNQSS